MYSDVARLKAAVEAGRSSARRFIEVFEAEAAKLGAGRFPGSGHAALRCHRVRVDSGAVGC